MTQLSALKPASIWKYFEEITKIPRPSGKEERIISFITDFAERHKMEYTKDNFGNILIRKPATKGYEGRKSVCLQSHLDMVCEKNSSSSHDFDNDPIQTIVEGDWLKAKDTTLGADNGVGVAAQMAILTDENAEHGPVECLFTVDEERGLNGAKGLGPGFFRSKTLINLDSEDEGELFIGCAGGMNTLATIKYNVRRTPEN